jgi:membrane protein
MLLSAAFKLLGRAVGRASEDDITTEAAALAFYTALSLAPLLMILLYVGGILGPEAQESLVRSIVRLVGRQTGEIIRQVIENLHQEPSAGTVSAVVGVFTLLLSATGVFAQLHASLNRIWGVKAKQGRGVFFWVRSRLVSLGMVGGAGLIMLVSLLESAVLHLAFAGQHTLWRTADLGISLVVNTLVFMAVFKLLPDVRIRWRDVWPGSALTAVLFIIGKYAIGKYLGHSAVGSAYGAAGSLVVFLAWVYYTSLIVFFGAEVTQATAHHRGREIEALEHATRE